MSAREREVFSRRRRPFARPRPSSRNDAHRRASTRASRERRALTSQPVAPLSIADRRARAMDFSRDDAEAYPGSSDREDDDVCFESDSEQDGKFAAYVGAHQVYASLAALRPRAFMRRNLAYGARASEEAQNRSRTTYEYAECTESMNKTKQGYGCALCRGREGGGFGNLRALMTHLRASHDLFRFSAMREGRNGADARIKIAPKGENFDDKHMFRLKSAVETRTAVDKQFVFYRKRRGVGRGRGYFRGVVASSKVEGNGDVRSGNSERMTTKWADLDYADMYDEVKADEKRREDEAERARLAAIPFKPKAAIKFAGGAPKLVPKRPTLTSKRPLGPFYHSRTFVRMDVPPTVDSDDEDPTADIITENEQFLNEFTDFSRDEIDFMVDWNAHVFRFRPLAEYDVQQLCETFARFKRDELRRNPQYFKYYMITVITLWDFGALNRRAVVLLLSVVNVDRALATTNAEVQTRVQTSVEPAA